MSADVAVKTYRARRRVKLAPDVWREPGELIPEAHGWFRLESWLHTGWIEDATVSEDEFLTAVEKFCPDDAGSLLHLAGIGEVTLHGTTKQAQVPAPRRLHRRKDVPSATARHPETPVHVAANTAPLVAPAPAKTQKAPAPSKE